MRERETVERSIGDLPTTKARSLGEMPILDPESQPTTVKLPVLKDYVLEKELGRGAFGVVYLAYHPEILQSQVVHLVILPENQLLFLESRVRKV